jgi:6-pyruvoyltetrahydropterin/6-carboxytetrahydropterin synthase
MRVAYTHQINSAHRLLDYTGKCQRIHGHNYGITFIIEAKKLNEQGMVVDFSVIKKTIGKWLDDNWDHRFLLYDEDPLSEAIPPMAKTRYGVVAVPFNPTAEGMAHYLLYEICPFIVVNNTIQVIAVEVEETKNCKAIAMLEKGEYFNGEAPVVS